MATYYLDYEGGSDAADGTTFANRWKTLTYGATAARIAPGDTVRIMGSPAPTSLGINGTWTDCPAYGPTVAVSISSSTNASPIEITSAANHNLSTGNYVYITGHTTNTAANGVWKITVSSGTVFTLTGSTGNGVGGASGTIENRSNCVIELASAVTKTIASTGNSGAGRTAWTASANVTTSLSSTVGKSGNVTDSIAVAAGFTTGLAAYKALGSAQDFSGYNQVSFFINQDSGTLSSAYGDISIKLCSDTVGVTAVNTINIPALAAVSKWNRFTVDTGGALGASIQSVAFYVNTDRGAQTFLIDNIIACKNPTSADSLTLTSLIGKNTGNETWYGIMSIDNTKVYLDVSAGTGIDRMSGYSGTTETVTTYKREPIVLPPLASTSTQSALGAIQDSGTSGSLIYFEGGWDRTAMTTQNLESWFCGTNGNGYGLYSTGKTFISINKLSFCYFYFDYITVGLTDSIIDNMTANNSTYGGMNFSGTCARVTIGSINTCNGVGYGLYIASGTRLFKITNIYNASNFRYTGYDVCGIYINGNQHVIDNIGTCSNCLRNLNLYGSYNVIKNITKCDNSYDTTNYEGSISSSETNIIYNVGSMSNARSYACSGAGVIYNVITSGSLVSAFYITDKTFLRNASISESTEFTFSATYRGGVYSEKHDGTSNNHYISTYFGVIMSESTTRHTASGISWKMSPTQTYTDVVTPLQLSIAKIACTANNLVTVKAWMRRSNTGLTMSVFCPGGQLAGVASDVTSSMTAAADTWEEITITFTPTEAGVIEIFANAYGGTTYNGYVDDITITQA